MEYFEIFNKVLLELNYRPVSIFENIVKTEHLRILHNINRVNTEVCSSFSWSFLEKAEKLTVLEGQTEGDRDIGGRIIKVFDKNTKLAFSPDYELFLEGRMPQNTYSYFNNRVLFGQSPKKRELTVYYTSLNYALEPSGVEKPCMEREKDKSAMPMPWAEQILVYGTCLKTKANPSYPKFGFWNSMYTMALGNMRAKCSPTSEDTPGLVINSRSGD